MLDFVGILSSSSWIHLRARRCHSVCLELVREVSIKIDPTFRRISVTSGQIALLIFLMIRSLSVHPIVSKILVSIVVDHGNGVNIIEM